jgi:phosphatidylserine decarboxylase
MKFHREGYESLFVVLIFGGAIITAAQFICPDIAFIHYVAYVMALFFLIVVLQFFRSPCIVINKNDKCVLSPADGKVVVIEEVEETEYFKDRRIQVSVFMSPINVHINRNPISGIVKYFRYHKGLYLYAWHPKSSTENERTTTVIQHKSGTQILFRQIAGALAKRIVWYVKEGDEVNQGEEMGFIKFGSRVDLFFPLGTKIDVKLNQTVKGGQTILAEIIK